MFGAGVVLLLFTLSAQIIAPKLLCTAPVFIFYGGWLLVVGEPLDEKTGQPAAWALIGAWLCSILGIIASIVIAALTLD